jgi:uncharacterized protein YjbJ (UPF0337 family)
MTWATTPEDKERVMNWDQIQGTWEQFKGELKTTWGKLTDDDLTYVGGHRDRLVGKLHERYGTLKDQAHKDIDAWMAKLETSLDRRDAK